ncbi:MAG: DUF2726 domain-containing protein [Patescibacteria group bacterium]
MWTYLAVIFIVALIVGIVLLKLGLLAEVFGLSGVGSDEKMSYRKKDSLLTAAEKSFYRTLRPIAEKNNYLLFAKVRFEDLLWIPHGVENRLALRNHVQSKHIDFVFCDKENVRPVLAIELDDASRQRDDRSRRDAQVDQILRIIGLPILRVRVRTSYDAVLLEDEIRKMFTSGNR